MPEAKTTAAWDFVDPISGELLQLVIALSEPSFFDGRSGVLHPGCNFLADVSADLDAFYCNHCGRGGRISGMWAVAAIQHVRDEQVGLGLTGEPGLGQHRGTDLLAPVILDPAGDSQPGPLVAKRDDV